MKRTYHAKVTLDEKDEGYNIKIKVDKEHLKSQEYGRLGGLARAKSIDSARASEIGKKAVEAREAKRKQL